MLTSLYIESNIIPNKYQKNNVPPHTKVCGLIGTCFLDAPKLKPVSYDFILKNGVLIYGHDKRGGWLKIVEAFFAILLITGVLLFLVSKGYIGNNEGNSEKVYQIENSIL